MPLQAGQGRLYFSSESRYWLVAIVFKKHVEIRGTRIQVGANHFAKAELPWFFCNFRRNFTHFCIKKRYRWVAFEWNGYVTWAISAPEKMPREVAQCRTFGRPHVNSIYRCVGYTRPRQRWVEAALADALELTRRRIHCGGGSADGLIFRVECAREPVVVNLLGLDGLSSLVHRAVFF